MSVAFEDTDVDGFEVVSPESDAGVEDIEPLLDGGAIEEDGSIERDVSNPEDLDSAEVREGSAVVPFLFTPCETNADCPLPGTVCMKEFQWSHQPTGSERTSIAADELFGPRLPAGQGVCTASCVSPLDDCRFTDVSGALVVWDCQLVAVGQPVHPGVDADWTPEYPLAEALDHHAMQRGQPFVAICRPDDSEPGGIEVCKECTRDADCGSGYCWDPVELSGVARADGVVQGYCMDPCTDNPECPLGFTCQSADSTAFCLPLEETCGACLDLDGDGYGVGRCTGTGAVSAVDCNDRDALSYYRGEDGLPDSLRCSADADSNCNGVNDDAELVGPGLWGALHCRGCGDVCDDTVVDDVTLVNGAIVCRESPSGENECRADCAPGFADCNGALADGCETPMGTDSDCSGCNDSCVSLVSGAPVGACSGTLDGISTCVIAECPTGTADCNGVFADGCETDTVSTLQSCGGCESDCTDRFAQAIEGCVDSRCTIASCASGFADCDLMPETGCEIDTRNDETHCGSCGRVCNLPNAISDCLLSTCTIADCRAGYEDCDGVAANGCEANLNSSVVH
ncbi:MAG: hypothetical protein KGO50_15480, partial [Myxococcales bacterium]|nr:hypothetical protein [Myxococcales bacterium]